MVPRKGFDVLIAALATLADLPWHLTIAGDRSRDPDAAARLDADIARFKLGNRIVVLGTVSPERLAELYAGADLFVLASRFEGYGMAFAEAIAHGLPVIGTTAGAIPETVPPGAGDSRCARRRGRARGCLASGNRKSGRKTPHGGIGARGGASASELAGLRETIRARARGSRMSGFSADWLALREPYDRRARNRNGARCGLAVGGRHALAFASSISPAAPARPCAR